MKREPNVGGQALIEGVLMRSPSGIGIAIRRGDGTIRVEKDKIKTSNNTFFKLPILRGVFALFSSMRVGINALNLAASEFVTEEDTFDLWLKKTFGEKAKNISIALTMLFSLVIAVLFFTVLPTFLVFVLKKYISNIFLLSVLEGAIKMVLFLGYIFSISKMKDVKRVFEYHGAEHKVVFNYESGEELSVENAKKFPRLHPRCGTSYVFFLLAISIFVSAFITFASPVHRVIIKLVLLPIIAGIGFEVLKYSAKGDSLFFRVLRKPGLWIQKITTSEPDDDQIEVAIEALKASFEGGVIE